jgi:uncharacterized membrane protein YozB (DUF420 family)
MSELLNVPGFLGTHANLRSDLTLMLMLTGALMLTAGWQLAVRKRYKAHRWVQTAAVIVNTGVVLATMISPFLVYIVPGIPSKLNEGSYGLTTAHGVVGLTSMLLGVFVVLRGHNLVPKAMRFKDYKPFMRGAYVLYLLSTLLGIVVYVSVYVFGI